MSDTTKFSEFIRNASPEEKERVYAKVMNEATEAQNNAGINSPHNACTFRKYCRKAEAQLAEKDAEIARLRKVLGWVDGEWHDCEICKQLDVKNAEIARLRDALTSKGFVECGIPACNCGAWHHRYGLPERWAEIKELLCYAEVLNNDTGNMPLNAIKKLIAQRDGLQERLDNRNKLGTPAEHVLQSNEMLCAELDALKNHLDASESEPVAWIRYCYDGSCEGPIMHNLMEDVRKKSGAWTPLFERDAARKERA